MFGESHPSRWHAVSSTFGPRFTRGVLAALLVWRLYVHSPKCRAPNSKLPADVSISEPDVPDPVAFRPGDWHVVVHDVVLRPYNEHGREVFFRHR